MIERKLAAAALAAAVLSLPGAAWAQQAAACDVKDMTSPPAVEWMHHNAWRYASAEAAQAAYLELVDGQSPWPGWFTPTVSVLQPGAMFQMAVS